MNTIELMLPAHWAGSLINGDDSGLDKGESELIDACIHGWAEDENLIGGALSVSDEPFFATFHAAWHVGVLPCDCLVYTFPVGASA